MQIWMMNIGPINSVVQWIWWFTGTTFIAFESLSTIECMIIKYLTIVVYKRMLPILDDFVARCQGLVNITVASFMGLVNCYSEEGFIALNRGGGLPPKMVILTIDFSRGSMVQ